MSQTIRKKITVVAIGVALTLLACIVVLAQDVKTNAMPGVDFSKFHTYKWVPIGNGSHPDQIVDAEIKQSIDAQLTQKGLTKTDSDKADLYVGYQIATDQEKQWNAYGMGGRWRFGGGMATATQSSITVGTLVLDMYDPSTKQLVWQGRASKSLDPSNNQQKNEERLNKGMAKLLKDFPPK